MARRTAGSGRSSTSPRSRDGELTVPRLPAERIPSIPEPVRTLVRNAVWTYGRVTARARPLPGFLILGAQKAGTTALYAYLRWHPEITGPSWKEVSFFDRHFVRGEAWYRGHFPNALRLRLGSARIVGEASPSYLFHPLAPERARALVPDARLIALVRNPVDRAYSHYQHERALGRESLSFEDAIAAEVERTRGEVERMVSDPSYFSHAWWNHTYLARGRYAEQLAGWLAVFPPEQLLVVSAEDLGERSEETYTRILEFLGARRHALGSYPRIFSRDYDQMKPETRTQLAHEYAEPNRRLYELLGRDLGWR